MKLKDAFSNLLMAYDKGDRRTLKDAFMIYCVKVPLLEPSMEEQELVYWKRVIFVSESVDEKERLWNTFSGVIERIPRSYRVVVMGDMNDIAGISPQNDVIGAFGVPGVNDIMVDD